MGDLRGAASRLRGQVRGQLAEFGGRRGVLSGQSRSPTKARPVGGDRAGVTWTMPQVAAGSLMGYGERDCGSAAGRLRGCGRQPWGGGGGPGATARTVRGVAAGLGAAGGNLGEARAVQRTTGGGAGMPGDSPEFAKYPSSVCRGPISQAHFVWEKGHMHGPPHTKRVPPQRLSDTLTYARTTAA